MGWNAILIEPYHKNYKTLIKLLSAVNIYNTQIVITKMLGIDETDGQKYPMVNIPGDVCDMEGKVSVSAGPHFAVISLANAISPNLHFAYFFDILRPVDIKIAMVILIKKLQAVSGFH